MSDYMLNNFIPTLINVVIALAVVYAISFVTGTSEDDVVGWVALGFAASAGRNG